MRRFGLVLTEDFWAGCFFEGDDKGGGGSGADDDKGDGKGAVDGKGGEEKFDAAYVKTLRDEAAGNRTKLRDLERKLAALETEKLTDTEKRELRAKQLEAENAQLKTEKREARIEAAATKAGARDPDVVAKLIPADAEDMAKAIAAIKKDKPYLFGGVGSADGGAGGRGSGGSSMNDLIRNRRG